MTHLHGTATNPGCPFTVVGGIRDDTPAGPVLCLGLSLVPSSPTLGLFLTE